MTFWYEAAKPQLERMLVKREPWRTLSNPEARSMGQAVFDIRRLVILIVHEKASPESAWRQSVDNHIGDYLNTITEWCRSAYHNA